jgi:shikimate kinase
MGMREDELVNSAKKLPNIFLVGPSGAGKSTIGREIAKIFQLDFYDTDAVIRERTGVEMAWVFDVEGEAGFRQREISLLTELITKSNNILVATGGITVLTEKSRQLIQENGIVIYLKASLAEQFERTSRNRATRPLLRGDNIKAKLVEMAKACDPFYQALANVTFETDKQSIGVVTKQISVYLKTQGY